MKMFGNVENGQSVLNMAIKQEVVPKLLIVHLQRQFHQQLLNPVHIHRHALKIRGVVLRGVSVHPTAFDQEHAQEPMIVPALKLHHLQLQNSAKAPALQLFHHNHQVKAQRIKAQ